MNGTEILAVSGLLFISFILGMSAGVWVKEELDRMDNARPR